MKTTHSAHFFAILPSRRTLWAFSTALFLTAFALEAPKSQGAQLAFSDFGPGNTYGSSGVSVGGQFINGYKFTSAATGSVSEIAMGIGGTGTFNLNLYTDNANTLGSSIWSASNIPVGSSSPNSAVINVVGGPALATGQNYWLVASGPANSANWFNNSIGAIGTWYHHDSGSDFYVSNSLGAFSVSVVPEPASALLLFAGLALVSPLLHQRGRRNR
jgi:hypothetical protein